MSAAAVAEPNAISRIVQIPLVDTALNRAHTLLLSNSYSAAAYNTGETYARTLYGTVEKQPVAVKLNDYANNILDMAEERYPHAFKISAEETKHVFEQYYARGQGYRHAAEQGLRSTVEQTQILIKQYSEYLEQTLLKLPGAGQANQVSQKLHESVHSSAESLISQVHTVVETSQSLVQNLSTETQKTLRPVLDTLQRQSADLSTLWRNKDQALVDRATLVLNYTRNESIPQVLEAFKRILTEATNQQARPKKKTL